MFYAALFLAFYSFKNRCKEVCRGREFVSPRRGGGQESFFLEGFPEEGRGGRIAIGMKLVHQEEIKTGHK